MMLSAGTARWAVLFLLGLGACSSPTSPQLQDAQGATLIEFEEVSRLGIRDGARLPTEIILRAPGAQLHLNLVFSIGVPTTLQQGTYSLERGQSQEQGTVRSRSITFLGGQSDNPNLGGVFELQGADGDPRFRAVVPTGEVSKPTSRSR